MSEWEDAPSKVSSDNWEDAGWEDASDARGYYSNGKRKGLVPEVGRTIDTAARNVADIATSLAPMLGGGLVSLFSTDAGDEIFRRMNTVQEMIHEGESTPETTLGKGIAGAIPMLASMPLGPAGIGTAMLAGLGRSGQHLIEQNVDPSTATVASGIDVGTNMVGALMPGGITAQTAANVGAGAAGDYLVQRYLQSKGYKDVAEQYDPLDPSRRITDAAVGFGFGVRSKLNTKQKESKLTDIDIEKAREIDSQIRTNKQEGSDTPLPDLLERVPFIEESIPEQRTPFPILEGEELGIPRLEEAPKFTPYENPPEPKPFELPEVIDVPKDVKRAILGNPRKKGLSPMFDQFTPEERLRMTTSLGEVPERGLDFESYKIDELANKIANEEKVRTAAEGWKEPTYIPGQKAPLSKQQEIDAAWLQRNKEVPQEPNVNQPSQQGQIKFGFGKQKGQIDPDLLTFGVSKLLDSFKKQGFPEEKLVQVFKGTFNANQLQMAIDTSFNPKARATLVWIKPQDFLSIATERNKFYDSLSGGMGDKKRASVREGLRTDAGLDDIPYLIIRDGPEGSARIIGHEGRHRMDVFIENGLDLIPVVVQHELKRWGETGMAFNKVIPQSRDSVATIKDALPIKLEPIFKSSIQGNKLLGQNKIGKSQRGSIGFNKEPKPDLSFDEFKRSLPEDLLENAPEIYKRMYGISDLGKVEVSSNNDVVKFMDKIPGLRGLAPVELLSKEEMLPIWKAEKDISTNVFRDALSSGGRMTALRSNNSFINWSVEKINSAIRDTEVVSKKAVHDIVSASNKLKTMFGTKDTELVETMRELMSKEGENKPLELNNKTQTDLAEAIRTSWDSLYKAINEERAARGIGPVPYRSNYLTAIFKGAYRALAKDSDGNVIGVVAAKNMKEAELAVAEITRQAREKGIEFTIEQPRFSKAFSTESFQKNIGAYYVQMNELMNLFGTESPSGKAFQDIATEWYDRRVRDHLGYRQHFKSKKGVIGSEGNKPWRDVRENALDMLDAQVEGLKAGWEWVAQQRAAREIHDVLNAPETQHLVNATEYVTKYYDHAFHRDSIGFDPIRGVIDGIAKQTGVDPSPAYEILGLARNGALVNTLGLSGSFLLSQIVQVPQAMVAASSYLSQFGLKANPVASLKEGIYDFTTLRVKPEFASKEGKYAYEYFSKHGTFDPHLLEKQIPRKLISTTGMSGFNKTLIDGIINGPIWLAETYNKALGKISIEAAETNTRGTFAMGMFHYLRRAGVDKEMAVRMADKATSDFFVDYNPHERAMMWSKLGELGKFASTVTTYKLNALNQNATFLSNKAFQTFALTNLALVGLSGITGLPGFDEIEDIFAALKRYVNPEIETPREYLLKEVPDVWTFGALATATDTNLQTKFNQGNIFPDDLSSFIFPLGRVLYNLGEAGTDAISNPSQETIGRLAWEIAPGGSKAPIEKHFFTNREGLALNPRKVGKGQYQDAGMDYRTDEDYYKRIAGLTSLSESKAKDIQFSIKRDQEIRDLRLTKHLTNTMRGVSSGDRKSIAENASKYLAEGGTQQALMAKLNTMAVGKNTNIKQRLLLGIKSGTIRQGMQAKEIMEYLNGQ